MANRVDYERACNILARVGADTCPNFFCLTFEAQLHLADIGRENGYRKPHNASGSYGRCFYAYLCRIVERERRERLERRERAA